MSLRSAKSAIRVIGSYATFVDGEVIPSLTKYGDLPPGVHLASWMEMEQRFGMQTQVRVRAMGTLRLLHDLARRTGCLRKFYVFGSFVSAKPEPRDVDVLLIMTRDFSVDDCPPESVPLFFHLQAATRYGASVFWFSEAEPSKEFLRAWQLGRDGALRGIVELA